MEIKGKVVQVLPIQEGVSKSNNPWKKATVIVEHGEQYPKKVALENMRDADGFASLSVGTEGVFHIEVESREYNGRWYTSVNCWKWDVAQNVPMQQTQPAPPVANVMDAQFPQQTPQPASPSGNDQELPF